MSRESQLTFAQRDEALRRLSERLDSRQLREEKYQRQEEPGSVYHHGVEVPEDVQDEDTRKKILHQGARKLRDQAQDSRLEYGVYDRDANARGTPLVRYSRDQEVTVDPRGVVRYRFEPRADGTPGADARYFACSGLRNYAVHLDQADFVDGTPAFALLTFPSLLPDAVHVSLEDDDESRLLPSSKTLEVMTSSQHRTLHPPKRSFADAKVRAQERKFLREAEFQQALETAIATSLFGYASEGGNEPGPCEPLVPLPAKLRDTAFEYFHYRCPKE